MQPIIESFGMRILKFATVLLAVQTAVASADESQKISWQQSKGIVDCANSKKYMCGRVQAVHDGDTIRVRPDASRSTASTRVRLLQVDAPELAQAYGPQSRDALSKVLPLGGKVCIVSPGRDRYRRVLGFVCLQTGKGSSSGGGWLDVNAWLLAGGHAWCYLGRCCPTYATASKAAMSAGLGLWAPNNGRKPQPPWLYRRQQRQGRRQRPRQPKGSGASNPSPDASSIVRK